MNSEPKLFPPRRTRHGWRVAALTLLVVALGNVVYGQQKTGQTPNILVIMGDDIGWFNPSCYNRGMMGYQTPNIDRIASEGALFNCWYGQQSCTAGRAAFVTGQSPIRTGLTKVGIPGADVGFSRKIQPSPNCSSPSAMRPANSGKTTWEIRTSFFLPTMALTSSLATSTT